MRIGGISTVHLAAVSTTVVSKPTHGARSTIERRRDSRIRSASTGSGARQAARKKVRGQIRRRWIWHREMAALVMLPLLLLGPDHSLHHNLLIPLINR